MAPRKKSSAPLLRVAELRQPQERIQKAAPMPNSTLPLKNGEAGTWYGFVHDAGLLWTFLSKAGVIVVGLVAAGFLAIPASRWQLDALSTKVETIAKELNGKIDDHGTRLQKAEDANSQNAVWQARVEEKLDGIGEKIGMPVKKHKPAGAKPASGFHRLFGGH